MKRFALLLVAVTALSACGAREPEDRPNRGLESVDSSRGAGSIDSPLELESIGGEWSLTAYLGDLPPDRIIAEVAGLEPNGYFWERVLSFEDPDLVDRLELDSEAGMFAAYGEREALEQAEDVLAPLMTDKNAIGKVLVRAQHDGFDLSGELG